MSKKKNENDPIPRGVCTARACRCDNFRPRKSGPMYCADPDCLHSVEWHSLSAKEIDA